ncbi:hypothetical protein GCM10017774_19600 [Lentzea cavernae]|uniref:Uncharacterized protein n=1 Tax=Lentzea cavernae TaxID=2020703 RepID=A0ABQ3M7I7_9PSEU|nr:hypothetical protein GCM10017774_19600 [Lentzea cavernae]
MFVVSSATVKKHVGTVFSKHGGHPAAIVYAYDSGFVRPGG